MGAIAPKLESQGRIEDEDQEDDSSNFTLETGPSWTTPTSLNDIISLADGRVVGVATSGFGAAPVAAPLLLYVSDSRRTSGDVSMARGTNATIELSLNATTGGVSAAVWTPVGRSSRGSRMSKLFSYYK